MTRLELIEYCRTYPNVYEDYPFDDISGDTSWTAMRHRQNKKTFAFIFERDGLCINLKCNPARSDLLRRVYGGVTPGYHMNKEHWNSVFPNSDLPQDELFALIQHSFELTAPKINSKRQS